MATHSQNAIKIKINLKEFFFILNDSPAHSLRIGNAFNDKNNLKNEV